MSDIAFKQEVARLKGAQAFDARARLLSDDPEALIAAVNSGAKTRLQASTELDKLQNTATAKASGGSNSR